MAAPRARLGAAAALAGAVAAAMLAAGAGEGVERATQDFRHSLAPPDTPVERVVIVAIDRESEDRLGRRSPFPRSVHGRLLDRLRAARPAAIAFDVQFSGLTGRGQDEALLRALERTPGVVLANAEFDRAGGHEVLGGEEAVASVGAEVANSAIPRDDDGVLRRLERAPSGRRALAVAVAERLRPRPPAADFRRGGVRIVYAGGPGTVRTVPLWQVLEGRVRGLGGRVVIVGAVDPVLGDVHATPVGDRPMAGPEIQANAIATLAAGAPLGEAPSALDLALTLLLALAAPGLALGLRAATLALATAVIAVAYLAAALVVFRAGTIVAVFHPLLALLLGFAFAFAVKYLAEIRERRRMRRLFSRFVPEQVVDTVVAQSGDLRAGGERVVATVMFSDLRGFTAFCEDKQPTVVTQVLNRYLSEMTEAIESHGGTVVSFMGDGIMAVFGAPTELPDHAARAVEAAREMAGPRLRSFNDWLAGRGLGGAFRMGIGVSTGEVMSGQVGAEARLEYTALGDTTNVGARLEAMTKETGHTILLSDATRRELGDGDGLARVGELPIRGRQAPLAVWTLDERS